ncbi:MAG: hypothetical protein JNL36_08780, partial [Candidatus Kapabacteria bacterium]|nr:hypothetical protein [Candidatus Kapabacteria bacterium]
MNCSNGTVMVAVNPLGVIGVFGVKLAVIGKRSPNAVALTSRRAIATVVAVD